MKSAWRLALLVSAADPKDPPRVPSDFHYDYYRVKRAAWAVFDRDTKRQRIVKKVYEEYPDLFWSSDSKKLYIVENVYIFSKKMVLCRVSAYDIETGSLKLLCELKQKGQAASYEDGKLLPYFAPLRIANDKYLLLQVPIRKTGKHNYHVLTVSLTTGERRDILAFTSSAGIRDPLIDWID